MKWIVGVVSTLIRRPRKAGGDTRSLPSLVKAMKVLVPRSVMREVIASSHDRRQWGVLAAAWVGVSEREFISAAANELHMPYHDRVVVPDLTVFRLEARSVLSSLRRIGASVVLEHTRIVSFIAADPAEIRGLALFDGTQSIFMAPWTEIAKALDGAERMIAEAEANADQSEEQRRRQLCERALEILISEAVSHGATSFEIVRTEDGHRYQFKTVEGRLAVGGVHPEALEHLLQHLASIDGETFPHSRAGRVLVRTLGSYANVRLSWSANRIGSSEEARSVELTTAAPTSLSSAGEGVHSSSRAEVVADPVPVLVVDDNPMFRRVLQRLLHKEGFEVSFAESGKDALRRLSEFSTIVPRLIICDLHMPEMNGCEFVAQLRGDARWERIPILMLTSDDSVEVELGALCVGVDALMSKTKDPRVLCAQVSRLTRRALIGEAA
jgi:two-component system chemotaxis response regulator CheY